MVSWREPRWRRPAVYGTVARMMLKPGSEQRMVELLREEEAAAIPGDRGTVVFRSDRDPNEFFFAILFESKEAYAANAKSPEMHQRYLQYRELLSGDPDWHDGEVVYSNVRG
jgi:heme-degrading monooxygenase HmoA